MLGTIVDNHSISRLATAYLLESGHTVGRDEEHKQCVQLTMSRLESKKVRLWKSDDVHKGSANLSSRAK